MKTLPAILFLLAAAPAPEAEDISALTALAEKGDAQAQYRLGYDYHYGFGVKIDPVKAIAWWRKSAEQKNPHAEVMLGSAYSEGWADIFPDSSLGIKWYQKAADQGDPDAEFLLAVIYEFAAGTLHDHEKALALWKESIPKLRVLAEKGDAEARCDLGTAYRNAWGVAQDDKESFRWRLKAAEQGHPLGQIAAAFNYHNGWGTPRDEAKAVFWIARAAGQGDMTAQLELARAYEKGVGIAQNYMQAYIWADIAMARGSSEAGSLMIAIAKNLKMPEVQQAMSAAHDWLAQHLVQGGTAP